MNISTLHRRETEPKLSVPREPVKGQIEKTTEKFHPDLPEPHRNLTESPENPYLKHVEHPSKCHGTLENPTGSHKTYKEPVHISHNYERTHLHFKECNQIELLKNLLRAPT